MIKEVTFEDKDAQSFLEDGYVLAFPTETVYGLGVRFDDKKAYERLCKAKNRVPSKPIAVMTHPDFDFSSYFDISPKALKVMKKFLPGPLTVLVKAKENTPYQVHLGTYVAGIRVPDKPDLVRFLASLPYPLQVTSANMSGEKALYTYRDVYEEFKENPYVKGIVRGECESGVPTTVVDLTGEEPVIKREGKITKEEILKAFQD